MTAAQGLMRKVDNFRLRMEPGLQQTESYFEVEGQEAGGEKERIVVTGIKGLHSTARIAQRMRDRRGMLLVSLKDVARSDEMRPCLERIKKDCRDHNYEMLLIDNEWIMALPRGAGIEFVSD